MTKGKTVQGLIFFKDKMGKLPITLRVTRDAMGQSISLADDNGGLILEIPVEPVKDLIEVKP